ncbi:hypothetical protein T4B_13917 [Trichinella pseudospiralis]|uniref:Uncharacterized protein n=1 Tax=Trichinella pseudospiralis TaxID=6337 RepID=A0A0V1GV15_TRIPS|nr:hypothetical protein T4B_13917 [Trichinella pseudospiralis]
MNIALKTMMHFIPIVNKRSSHRSLGLRGQNRWLEGVFGGGIKREERRKELSEKYEESSEKITCRNHTGKFEKMANDVRRMNNGVFNTMTDEEYY